ncbi:MAG TPA: hypothetical protein VKA21_12525 [Candidatus Binatia bacterium]|nr:hypothetical protein [Candidatus Binatia bacterium]
MGRPRFRIFVSASFGLVGLLVVAGSAAAQPCTTLPCATGADCDDQDPCTNDSCGSVAGAFVCQHAPNTGDPCDDGDGCTIDDTCQAGACLGTDACHFECYETDPHRITPIPGVNVTDAFGTRTVTLTRVLRLCTPTNKNGESPGAETSPNHLLVYDARAPRTPRVQGIAVTNQFGTLSVDTIRMKRLVAPTPKGVNAVPPPLSSAAGAFLDHYACYRIRTTRGTPRFNPVSVDVQDQFASTTLTIGRPRYLCAPADKNGESPGAETHSRHLLCYPTKKPGSTGLDDLDIHLEDQFGPRLLHINRRDELCVPSTVVARCGNGVTDPGEVCDPPDMLPGTCTAPAASVGLHCSTNDDCDNPRNGVCNFVNGTCTAPVASIGNACTKHTQCDNPSNGTCALPSQCVAPPSSVGIPCTADEQCDDPPGASNGECAPCAATDVCNAQCVCQPLADFCTDNTPPTPPAPAMFKCIFPPSMYGAACTMNGLDPACDDPGGAGNGRCNQVQHKGTQRPLQGGWNALNALDSGNGTLGSFPIRNSANARVLLSNNHVFARSSGNVAPTLGGGAGAALGERINQPNPGAAAGSLTDYEFLCFKNCRAPAARLGRRCVVDADCDTAPGNGRCGGCSAPAASVGNACTQASDCDNPAASGNGRCQGGDDCAAAGGLNQINTIGANCIDAGVARPCAAILAGGDILDVGSPAPLAVAGAKNCTPLSLAPMGLVVKKSGQRTGLTCGVITSYEAPGIDYHVCAAPAASVGQSCDPNATDADCDAPAMAGNGVCQHRNAQFTPQQLGITATGGFGFDLTTGMQGLNGGFSFGGDSGSLVLGAASNKPVGLLFGGRGTGDALDITFANPIDLVLRRFGVHY